MKKNVAGQKVGCQMVATDGTAFTGAVTVAVTVDAGTQATGTVGSGACTHEGNGYHTYAPSQAETNGDLIAFTFTGTGAVPATVQVYTGFPQGGDNFARLGAPSGASIAADIGTRATQTSVDTVDDFLDTEIADIQSRLPAALVSGRMNSNMAAISDDATAADNLETAFDESAGPVPWLGIADQGTAQAATSTTLQLRAGAPSSDDAVSGMLVGAFGSAQGFWQFRIITDYVGSSKTATVDGWAVTPTGTITYKVFGSAASVTENADLVDLILDEALSGHATAGTLGKAISDIDTHTDTETGAAAIRTALGLSGANLDTQLTAISSKTTNLPADPADASDIANAFSTVNATLTALTGLVDDLETRLSAARAGYLDNLNPATGVTLAPAGSLALTEGYAADGATATLAQLLYAIKAILSQFAISGTTLTTKRLDGTTTAEVYTMDSATTPTAITRTA